MKRIYHVDLDSFFVAVEELFDPSLKGKPVVVGRQMGDRGVIACASYEARSHGLRAGMSLVSARRLCPQVLFIPGQFDAYQAISEQFMLLLGKYSPFLEPLSLDEAYLDMTGFDSLYGSHRDTASRIKNHIIRDLGITASIGIGSSKTSAKVASDLEKPNGLVEISPGDDAAFLAPLPVKVLPGVGPKTLRILERIHVATVADLASVPPLILKSVLGNWGTILRMRANGEDTSCVRGITPAKSISRETTFPEDTTDPTFLLATLRNLTEKVGSQLRQENKATHIVILKLRYHNFHTITRQQTLPHPTTNDETLFQSVSDLLLKALLQLSQPVRLIGIVITRISENNKQLRLLDTGERKQENLTQALDKIRERYGFDSVQTGRTLMLER